MTRYLYENSQGEQSYKYRLSYYLPLHEMSIYFNDIRKEALARRDEMIVFQKENSSDREYVKFFKEEAGDSLKEYRACCLIMGILVVDPPKDCSYKEYKEWPFELENYYDRVIRKAEERLYNAS